MKRNLKILMFLLVALFLCSGNSFSLELGTSITIWDKMGVGSEKNPMEDGEVEPNCVWNQNWDLEGFFLDGSKLTMVGGFNFKNGQFDGARTYTSGDIFIDINGDAKYGPLNAASGSGYSIVKKTFGYDYVIDLNFSDYTYNVLSLNDDSYVKTVWFSQNDESNAFQYERGGKQIKNGSFDYITGLSNSDVNGLLGGTHNAVIVDLSFLGDNVTFTSHFTMGCGNDNLMGSGTTSVPEPTPMLLLGGALIGLAGIGRRKFFKN